MIHLLFLLISFNEISANLSPVKLNDLHPLSLTWNQVHYLVRENLYEINELRKEHEALYAELRKCYGLEGCLKEQNLLNEPDLYVGEGLNDQDLGAGALIASLKRNQGSLGGYGEQVTTNINQQNVKQSGQQHYYRHQSKSPVSSWPNSFAGNDRSSGRSHSQRQYQYNYEYSSSSQQGKFSKNSAPSKSIHQG